MGRLPEQILRPQKGHALYQRYLAELVLADKVGFDAVVVNEHHNTSYSMMAAPSLIAAAIIPQIKNAKICVWGTPPNLEYPNRLAEEYAMLDVMSEGRLEVAFPLGTGMEYWANPINPATARERHRESIDIILQAWTQDGPTTYYGDFYTYRYLNPWPRPYQKPHPPCYIVGTGSPETSNSRPSSGSATRRCSSPNSARLSSIRTCAGWPRNTATTSGRSSFRSR